MLNVIDYYTQCKIFWDEMSALQPLPVCECAPICSCELVNKIRKERKDDQVIWFLKRLNDDFTSIKLGVLTFKKKSGVLVLDPMPNVYKVFGMTLKLEIQNNVITIGHIGNDIVQANASQGDLTEPMNEEIVVVPCSNNTSSSFNNKKRFN